MSFKSGLGQGMGFGAGCLLFVILLLVGCVALFTRGSGSAVVPQATGIPIPSPVAVAPTSSPSPTLLVAPTPSSGPQLALVPCVFDLAKDKYCQNGQYHITNPVSRGRVVTLTFKVRNIGSAVSGALSAVVIGCNSETGGCHHEDFFLPDRFTLLGCAPSCAGHVVNDRTTWELEWAGKIAPGKTMTLTVSFRATHVAYNYIEATLRGQSLKQYNEAPLDTSPKLGEWNEMQVVVVAP